MMRTMLHAVSILAIALALGADSGWGGPVSLDGLQTASPVLALVPEAPPAGESPDLAAHLRIAPSHRPPSPCTGQTGVRLPTAVRPHAEWLPYYPNAPPPS